MRKHIFKNITGFCPTINGEANIEIEYSEVSILGSPREQYRAVSLDCDYSDKCSEGYCPIMKENLTFEL